MAEIHPQTGPKILYYRKLREWSVRELADRSGVSFSLVASYERREVAPQFGKVSRLAKALGVTVEHLTDMTPPPEAEPGAKPARRRKPRCKPRGALKIVR